MSALAVCGLSGCVVSESLVHTALVFVAVLRIVAVIGAVLMGCDGVV